MNTNTPSSSSALVSILKPVSGSSLDEALLWSYNSLHVTRMLQVGYTVTELQLPFKDRIDIDYFNSNCSIPRPGHEHAGVHRYTPPLPAFGQELHGSAQVPTRYVKHVALAELFSLRYAFATLKFKTSLTYFQ